jgi:hypothetical protein
MKSKVVRMSAVAVATAALTLGASSAARADETLATRLKVPFAFIVSNVQLPAGDYTVKEVSAGNQVVEIVSADGHHMAFVATIPWRDAAQPKTPELVFEKFSGAYFLSRIVPTGGDDREIVLTPALMEREIMRSGEHAAD